MVALVNVKFSSFKIVSLGKCSSRLWFPCLIEVSPFKHNFLLLLQNYPTSIRAAKN
jgi:hypothetical protein